MSVQHLSSPDGHVWLELSLDRGTLYWHTVQEGVVTSARASVGIVTATCDLSNLLPSVAARSTRPMRCLRSKRLNAAITPERWRWT